MRSISLLILTILSTGLLAQTSFVYVDVSGNLDRDVLKSELKSKVNTTDEFLYFISNDNAPFISNSYAKLLTDINELSMIKPSTPITFKEIDTLITYFDKLTTSIILSFYFDYQYAKSAGIQSLVERLLISNEWLNKNGLKKGVQVKLYFQQSEQLTHQQINEITNNGKYEVIIY
jgi:hypothetical protein